MKLNQIERSQLMHQRKEAYNAMIKSDPCSAKRKELKAEYMRLLKATR
jgi:hypothetical protein